MKIVDVDVIAFRVPRVAFRNGELLACQERISMVANQRLVGTTVRVLVEGYSKAALKAQEAEQTRGEEVGWRRSNQLVGRTRTDQIVVFQGKPKDIGRFTEVRITAATALTLHGTLQEESLDTGDRAGPVSRSGPVAGPL